MRMQICSVCESEFDLDKKIKEARDHKRSAGKINECPDCVSDEPVLFTGVMIYGHKTAGTLQVNKDPRITQYMLGSSPSAGTKFAMSTTRPPSSAEGTITDQDDINKRR